MRRWEDNIKIYLKCGSLPQCNERYRIGVQNDGSDAHWVALRLATAGGKMHTNAAS
jgi:hypothetical protein